jgi:hypothetical protein
MLTIVVAFLTVAAVTPSPAADNSGVVTSAKLTRTAFLSTEDAQATISVLNPTASRVVLDLGASKLRVYSNGTWEARPYCTRNCWRESVPVPLQCSALFPLIYHHVRLFPIRARRM